MKLFQEDRVDLRNILRSGAQNVAHAVPATVNAVLGQNCLLLFVSELRNFLRSSSRIMVFQVFDGHS